MNNLELYVGRTVEIVFIDGTKIKQVLRKFHNPYKNCDYYFFDKETIIPICINKIRGLRIW